MKYLKLVAVLCLLAGLDGRLHASPIDLNRQVLLADGKPAAGAQVDIWIFDGATTRVKEHRTLRLPADGWLHA